KDPNNPNPDPSDKDHDQTLDPDHDILYPSATFGGDKVQDFFVLPAIAPGSLGSALSQVCLGGPSPGAYRFSFNPVGTAGSSLPAGAGGTGSGYSGLSGSSGPSQYQDSIARRDEGLQALMERLWKRARRAHLALASNDDDLTGIVSQRRGYKL